MELRKRTKHATALRSGTTQRAIAALHAYAHDEASARGATALSLAGRLEPRLLGHAPDRDDLVLVLSKDEYVLQLGPEAQTVASAILESLKSSGSQRGTRAFTESELAALEEGGAELLHAAPDRTGTLRAILEFASLIGDAYTVQQAAQLLSVNPSRIRQRLTARPPTGSTASLRSSPPTFRRLRSSAGSPCRTRISRSTTARSAPCSGSGRAEIQR
jgi:hypothetical protein